ncbi:MAG: hypothetical protein KDA92_06390 [Planctomycetales bacterium]|nr:hypothetical protein [Planctomycetales bacterium]MCA9166140.1 hypothetical protein [Planctomycetales bacterium]
MVLGIVFGSFVLFALAILWNPANILALAITVYSFEQYAQANSTFFGAHASLINICFGVLTLWALICVTLRGGNPLQPMTHAMWAYLALFIFAAISTLWAVDRTTAMFVFKFHLPYIATFSVLLPLVIQRPQDVEKGFISTLAFGTFVCALLLLTTRVHAWGRTIEAVGGGVIDRLGEQRNRLSPLAVAEMCGQLLIIAVLMNFSGVNRIWQILRWVVSFLAFALIYRSGSRGQLIAAMLTIIMLITFSRGAKKATGWVAAAVTTFLVVGFAVFSFSGFADHTERWAMSDMQGDFANTRIDYVSRLLTYWMESSPFNWLFGLGNSSSFDERIIGRYCHVLVAEVMGELGFFGMALFLTLVVFVARDCLRAYQLTKDKQVERGVTVTLIGLCIYQGILTFKQGSLLNNYVTFGVLLIMARHAAVTQAAVAKEKKAALQRRWYEYYMKYGNQAIAP